MLIKKKKFQSESLDAVVNYGKLNGQLNPKCV